MEATTSIYSSNVAGKRYPFIYAGLFIVYFLLFFFASRIIIWITQDDAYIDPSKLWNLTNFSLILAMAGYILSGVCFWVFGLFRSVEQVFFTRIGIAILVYFSALGIQYQTWMQNYIFKVGKSYDVIFDRNYEPIYNEGKKVFRVKTNTPWEQVLNFSVSYSSNLRINIDDTYADKKREYYFLLNNKLESSNNNIGIRIDLHSIILSTTHWLEDFPSAYQIDDFDSIQSTHPELNLHKKRIFKPTFCTETRTVELFAGERMEVIFEPPPEYDNIILDDLTHNFARMKVTLIEKPDVEFEYTGKVGENTFTVPYPEPEVRILHPDYGYRQITDS